MKEEKPLLHDKENRISESKSKGVAEEHILFTKTHGKILIFFLHIGSNIEHLLKLVLNYASSL